jgi:hypothetical protein
MATHKLTIQIEVQDIEATWDKGDLSVGINPGWAVANISSTAVLFDETGTKELGTIHLFKPLRDAIIDHHYDELSEAYAKEQP